MSSSLKLIIAIIVLAVLGALVYFSATSGVVDTADDILTLASPEASVQAQTVSQEINNLLGEFRGIGNLSIDNSVLDSPVYQELRATVLPALKVYTQGRENPFLQIGEEANRSFDQSFQQILSTVRALEPVEEEVVEEEEVSPRASEDAPSNTQGVPRDELESLGIE